MYEKRSCSIQKYFALRFIDTQCLLKNVQRTFNHIIKVGVYESSECVFYYVIIWNMKWGIEENL